MVVVRRIVLDVLKPHQPDAIEFCRGIACLQSDYQVCLTVQEMDEHTESLQIEIRGSAIELGPVESAIASMGGSLHSIDQVEVVNAGDYE